MAWPIRHGKTLNFYSENSSTDLASLSTVIGLQSESFFFSFLFFLRATPRVYGGSQTRGQIRAIAASLCHSHSNTRSEPAVCDLHHRSGQHWILNPLSGARDETHILVDTSQDHYC